MKIKTDVTAVFEMNLWQRLICLFRRKQVIIFKQVDFHFDNKKDGDK